MASKYNFHIIEWCSQANTQQRVLFYCFEIFDQSKFKVWSWYFYLFSEESFTLKKKKQDKSRTVFLPELWKRGMFMLYHNKKRYSKLFRTVEVGMLVSFLDTWKDILRISPPPLVNHSCFATSHERSVNLFALLDFLTVYFTELQGL